MKEIISRCDRCKKKTEDLISYSFVNKNVELDDGDSNDTSLLATMWGKHRSYPTVSGELCIDCIQIISHWLGHSENKLVKKEVI